MGGHSHPPLLLPQNVFVRCCLHLVRVLGLVSVLNHQHMNKVSETNHDSAKGGWEGNVKMNNWHHMSQYSPVG